MPCSRADDTAYSSNRPVKVDHSSIGKSAQPRKIDCPMHGEIVFTTTSDKVRLHGLYRQSTQPTSASPNVGSVDAAVLVHGLGGNFYSSRMLSHFSTTLLELGIAVVVGNTRGHDMINTSTWGGRSKSIGAALEDVGDCKYDIPAWCDFLKSRGHANLLVVGHSLGGIKALYTQAYAPHPIVRSIIGLSATRLSYKRLIDSPGGEKFRETISRCEALVSDGQSDIPVQVPFPFPTWMTPQCYLDKYGPNESFNWLHFIDQVEIPTLLIFGQRELDENAAFEGLRPELQTLVSGWSSITFQEVEEADHFYSGKYGEVDNVLNRWLTQ